MELNFKIEQVPSLVYMEFDTDNGKSFVVFQNGVMLENCKGISLIHNDNEYGLDLEREIGFTE
jgi:hypothetical protein